MLLLTILLILWPYLFFAGYAIIFSLDGNEGTLFVAFAILYTIISAYQHHLYRRYSTTLGIPVQTIAKYNLLLKLIPAVCDTVLYSWIIWQYIETSIAIAGGAMMCVPMFLIYFILLIPYTLSRLFSLFTTMQVSKHLLEEYYWETEQTMLKGHIWLHTALHLLPVCHIVSNIIVYRKLRKLQPETIEA